MRERDREPIYRTYIIFFCFWKKRKPGDKQTNLYLYILNIKLCNSDWATARETDRRVPANMFVPIQFSSCLLLHHTILRHAILVYTFFTIVKLHKIDGSTGGAKMEEYDKKQNTATTLRGKVTRAINTENSFKKNLHNRIRSFFLFNNMTAGKFIFVVPIRFVKQ